MADLSIESPALASEAPGSLNDECVEPMVQFENSRKPILFTTSDGREVNTGWGQWEGLVEESGPYFVCKGKRAGII